MTTPILGIAGWKNSGKTTLVERLVAELVSRGFRVSTIKHAHHDFDVDIPGTDSWRHRAAGAQEAAIVSSRRWALMRELRDEAEPTLDEILARMAPADLVIVEGYKKASHRKIEVRRHAAKDQTLLTQTDPAIVAVATDQLSDTGGVPAFGLDDIASIADFVVRLFGLQTANR